MYSRYIEKHRLILEKLEQSFKRNKKFEQVYRDFETQKVCYLPLNTFMLRPLQRILHYQLLVERLLKIYESSHPDYTDCSVARMQLEHIVSNITHNIHATVSIQMSCLVRKFVKSKPFLWKIPGKFRQVG